MKKINVNWLNSCPACDSSDLTVHKEGGNESWLYEDDDVECGCGEKGHIEISGVEEAYVVWENE